MSQTGNNSTTEKNCCSKYLCCSSCIDMRSISLPLVYLVAIIISCTNLFVEQVMNIYQSVEGVPKKVTDIKKILTRIECWGPNFSIEMTWECLFLLCFTCQETTTKTVSRKKGCRLLAIERWLKQHSLRAFFLGQPLVYWLNKKSSFVVIIFSRAYTFAARSGLMQKFGWQ